MGPEFEQPTVTSRDEAIAVDGGDENSVQPEVVPPQPEPAVPVENNVTPKK